MLNLTNLFNLEVQDILTNRFDLGIFASGYESRSSFLAGKLNKEQFSHIIIFGFEEHSDDTTRKKNDQFYEKNYCLPILLSSQDQIKLYAELQSAFAQIENQYTIRILIDYTSMARLWYSGILNFLRLQREKEIDVYINYSIGTYSADFLDYTYTSINSIPSLEGSLSSNNKTLLVMAVGFSPYLVKSVVEEIEPNHVIGVLASPSITPQYEEQSSKTKDILANDVDQWINCPIDDLEIIFSKYAEITNYNINDKDIIFLSLGPKIFTIASVLISQRFDQVTCLYLKTKRTNNDVKPSGKFICNHLSYRP